MRLALIALAFAFFAKSVVFAQSGPGGVGNAAGSTGQPQNVLWLKANTGVSSSGGLVNSWTDQSGNNNSATGAGASRPTFNSSDVNFNSLPTISFPVTGAGGQNYFLQVPDNDNLDNSSNFSIITVVRPTTPPATAGIVSKRTAASTNLSYGIQISNTPRYQGVTSAGVTYTLSSVNTIALNTVDILSLVVNGTNIDGLLDGASLQSVTGPSVIPNGTANLFIGSLDGQASSENFEGQIAEVILFKGTLNTAQRQIIENYLGAKYGLTLPSTDFYAGDTPGNGNHDFDLAGIGFNGGTSHSLANSQGFILSPSGGTLDANGEFVLAAHDGVNNVPSTSNLGTGGVVQRWARTWFIDRTPASGIDVNIAFDFSEGIAGQFPQNKNNYVLLKLNTGTNNYDVVSAIASSDKTLVGDQIVFRVADSNLSDGVYTLGTLNSTASPVNGVSNRTWYSYQSGNWNDPTVWTLDGGIFPLFVNPSNEIPSATDNVEITSGRTITMNINSVQVNSVNVVGTLDLLSSTGHNFVKISGSGRIKIAGAIDNFPLGNASDFANTVIGGTLEINGTGISLNAARTFRNVEINLSSSSSVATLENDYVLNGYLTIASGILKFNNDVAITNRTLTVNGNVTVASSGGITVGNTNSRHEFNLYGDFINDGGTAYFTQRTAANPSGAEATDGIVDVNILSASRDQQIQCNGITRFYRIEISKGIDDTYKASISASSAANFNLFGRANYDINEANATANGNGTNLNALGLNIGTVEIGLNVNIPSLNVVSNYSIYEGAQIWVNGGSVTKPSGTAIVPYGTLRVSSGVLSAPISSGITIRESGIIWVEGGTVTVNQIRTSIAGVSAVGSYIQSGGDVTLTGNTVSDDYAVFSLTYTGNVFNMSGGTLTIQSASNLGTSNLRGVIFINSAPANVNVTGGTVVMEADLGVTYRVNSRASFWNVVMRATGGARAFQLLGTTSGTGGGAAEPSLAIQPLVVFNDFTIENNASFTTNNANVTVSGNFEIQNGGAYLFGTNTTTINGDGVSSLVFGNTAATQSFNNLVIDKTNVTDEVVIGTGNAIALRVNGTFTINKGVFDYSTFAASARGTVILGNGIVVGKSTSTGSLLLDGTVDQTLNSSSASIHNLQFNNTDPTPVITLGTGNLTLLRTLTMTSGIFNIGTFKLTLNGAAAVLAGAPFSVSKMIQTSANASDGGLELYLDANETLFYPLGVAGKYTPVTATFSSFSDDGLIKISPVNGVLQTTNLSGGANILAYYWRAGASNFTARPTVSYLFTYETVDVGGSEAAYVPGKVLDTSPFTRSFENDVNKVNDATNVITFNGAGAGFVLEDANYTAGGTTRFTGTPRVFYSYGFGDAAQRDWRNGNYWTFGTNGAYGVHDSRQTAAGDYPHAGDIAVVGWVPFGDPAGNNGRPHGIAINNADEAVAELRFNRMLDVSNNPTARVYAYNFQFRPTVCINNLGTQGQLLQGKVSGEGMFWIRSTGGNLSDPSFANVDLGAFNLQDSSYVVYESTLGNANYVNTPAAYPNLMMATDGWGNQDKSSTIPNNITVNGDLELLGNINLVLNTGATGDITVNRRLRFFRSNANGNDSGGGSELRFSNTGTPRTVTVFGDLLLGNGYAALISVGSPGATPITHTFNLYGNFRQNTTNGNGFKAGSSSTNDRIHLNLFGANSMVLTNTSGDTPQFYSVTVDKGTSVSTTAAFNSNFTINGPTNLVTKSLLLQNGLFIINNASVSVVLTSGGGDFNIPSTAGLEIRSGAVSTTLTNVNANIVLDGLLRISGGTATIDSGVGFPNYIEYSNSGNSAIEVTGGNLTIGGQVRRSPSNATGSLKYTQSAGTVVVGSRGAPLTNRGVFEVLNPGSQFNHSGGSFTVVQGINSSSIPSLWLEPSSSLITSNSTITIGNASTPSGANSQNIGIQSTAILNNLTIAGSNNPVIKIYITPLTVNGNLIVSSSTTLNANNQNLTIGGNFTVDGSYVPTSNVTTFTNTSAAAISGLTPLLNFYDFVKTGGGVLTITKDITINQDLKILAGSISTSSFAINLRRHALLDGTISSTSGSGLIFGGSAQQQLRRSALGTSTLGIVSINNAFGVIIPDGNGYNFDITTGLRLQQGVFDIGGGLLFLQTAATITPVSPFSVSNMIQTNSSFTDKGVRKQFPLNYTTDFTFPVGQLAYTPVIFNFSTAGNTTGSVMSGGSTPVITVRPANERHPSVVDDNLPATELPSPAAFNDLNNVLQYHWIINADNVSNTFKSAMTLSYVQSLVSFTAPYTEADYIAARILTDNNPSKLINKFTTSDVDETLNVITFVFNGVTDSGISAEYFAGVDVAIPDNVPVYTTTMSGNANAAIYTPVVPGGGAPRGATVIVQSGHNLTFDVASGSLNLYETQISAGARITIPTGSVGHRLGTVTGTGDLRIDSNTGSAVLPAAVYDDFFSCSGGGLIYGGTGSYEILGSISFLRRLTLEGTGPKTLANNDITICNNFTLNGGSFGNPNNRSITVQNDVLMNAVGFYNFAGTLSVTRDFVQTAGTYFSGNGGLKTIGRDLTISGGTLNPGSGSTNIIQVNGNMDVAAVATISTGTGGSTGQRFTFGGSSTQTLTGNYTGTRGFNRLEINNSNGLTVLGNTTVVSELLLTSGLITPGSNTFLLELGAVSNPVEGKSTSFVNGKLYKVLNNGQSFTFPIGKASVWRSASVNGLAQTGTVTWDMEYIQGSATGAVAAAPAPRNNPVNNFLSADPLVLRIANGEYWRVSDGSATSNGRTAKVGLSWGIESDVSANLAQREALKVMSWNGVNWTNNGGTNFQPGASHTQARGTFVSTANLSFSENIVTLGSTEIANPLPISLAWFKGEVVGDEGYLYWKTESELNNDYFEIQRSFDGGEFEVIGKVNGNGTTESAVDYMYEDASLQYGKNYYRLRQVDFDGKFSFSKTIVLEYTGAPQLGLRVFPNPTRYTNINFKVNSGQKDAMIVRLFDLTGRIVYKAEISTEQIGEEVQIKTETLKNGMYVLEVIQGKGRATQRVIIQE